jgi:hypothetical protein
MKEFAAVQSTIYIENRGFSQSASFDESVVD